ncbi:Fimbrial protein precursor [Photobacterium malacitanum]|uniref:Fimbrial protein n=1 Tax=Photobacterium malacitanum TaxID=2204294 RepID=A0A1Y6MLT2_9GAMM|nr:type IV pilin protein [Photobacterium malacitanum]SMY37514.1 Fimbrial protein precursor [Photobacterium malacitanum]
MIKQKGVTLIEMLIAVAIIGVLTAIAYPSYQDHVLKGHRTQAMGDLMMIQLAMEDQRTGGKDYLAFDGHTNSEIRTDLCGSCANDERYSYKISASDTAYTITATPKTVQASDECSELKLDQTSKGLPEGCW